MTSAQQLELIEMKLAQAEAILAKVSDESLIVDLSDGRTISAPILWFPRLAHGTVEERANLQVMGDYIYWPDLDEDIPVRALLLGKGRGESAQSLQRWLEQRHAVPTH